mmetsp:Transcript_1266/g.2120  ORF Transcript_1266/g.2120 Transcript_1266/m.2120 type:complete len:450 (+) Transcript_1266:48-1397(+)
MIAKVFFIHLMTVVINFTIAQTVKSTNSPTISNYPPASPTISLDRIQNYKKYIFTIRDTTSSLISSNLPTRRPTKSPTKKSTISPTVRPANTFPTLIPSKSNKPNSVLTQSPSQRPTFGTSTTRPSKSPSSQPTNKLSTEKPNLPTKLSTKSPTRLPSRSPTTPPKISQPPSVKPSMSPTNPPDIVYHDNLPIMTGPINLYNIYMGDYHNELSPTGTRTLMDYFATNLGNSSWYDTITKYYQMNSNGTKTYASHVVNFPQSSVNIYPAARGSAIKLDNGQTVSVLTDEIIQNAIVSLLSSGRLPVDTSGIYAVMFRGDFASPGWLVDWCGFHQNFALADGRLIKYFIAGDLNFVTSPQVNNCAQLPPPSVNGNFGADAMASVYAHEVAELVTDYAQAWSSNVDSLENGDLCQWKFGDDADNGLKNWNVNLNGRHFLLQEMYLPGVGCVL